jgi:hypothetical protein
MTLIRPLHFGNLVQDTFIRDAEHFATVNGHSTDRNRTDRSLFHVFRTTFSSSHDTTVLSSHGTPFFSSPLGVDQAHLLPASGFCSNKSEGGAPPTQVPRLISSLTAPSQPLNSSSEFINTLDSLSSRFAQSPSFTASVLTS